MSWWVRHTRALCSLQDESVMLDKQHRDEQAFHTGLSVLFGSFFFVSGLFFKPFFLSLFCPCAETRQHSIPALCCNQISAEQLECFIFSCSSTFQLLMENAIIRHRRLRKQADENVKDAGHPGPGTSGSFEARRRCVFSTSAVELQCVFKEDSSFRCSNKSYLRGSSAFLTSVFTYKCRKILLLSSFNKKSRWANRHENLEWLSFRGALNAPPPSSCHIRNLLVVMSSAQSGDQAKLEKELSLFSYYILEDEWQILFLQARGGCSKTPYTVRMDSSFVSQLKSKWLKGWRCQPVPWRPIWTRHWQAALCASPLIWARFWSSHWNIYV